MGSDSRQVIVDDERNLLDIDTSRPHIRSDQHTRGAASELGHDSVSLLLHHLSVHAANGEVGFTQFLREPVDLSARVAEDDRLRDGQRVVQVAPGVSGVILSVFDDLQSVVLPVLLLDSNEELLDALERQLVTLDKHSNRVGHELGGHLKDVVRKRGRDDDDLGRRREISVDIVDLVLETFVEQLVGLVKDEHLRLAWRPGN